MYGNYDPSQGAPQGPPQPYPPQPGYAPQPYGRQPEYAPPPPPQQYAPPPQPQVNASMDDFFAQPTSGGGPSLKFQGKPKGTSYSGVVSRAVTRGDIRAQTNPGNGQVQTYRDGRPKLVMVVPLILDEKHRQEFPELAGAWWVKGQARDELVRAMEEAGAPAGAPEKGAHITVTLVDHRQIPGFSQPQFVYAVTYQRPAGEAAAPASVSPHQEAAAVMTGAAPVPQPGPAAMPVPQAAAPPAPAAAGVPGSEEAVLAALTAEQRAMYEQMSPEQRAMFRQMQGKAA